MSSDVRTPNQQTLDAQLDTVLHHLPAIIGAKIAMARRSCLTCMNFDEKKEQCTTYKQRPPARVIAFGCDSFEEDIPF